MITRDTEILRKVGEHNRISVSVTITTMDSELARKLEPRAPRPDLRMEAVRQLNLAGVSTGVNCAPVLPEITDRPRDLEALVKAASEAGAKFIHPNPLFSQALFGGGVFAISRRAVPCSGGFLPEAIRRSCFPAERIRGAIVAIDGGIPQKIRDCRPATTQRNSIGCRSGADEVVLREIAGRGRPALHKPNLASAYNGCSHMSIPAQTPPRRRFTDSGRQFWHRVTEGLRSKPALVAV